MPNMLQLKHSEIDAAEKRGKYNVCILGVNPLSILYALAFVEAGFKVTVVDTDLSVIKRLTQGKAIPSQHERELKIRNLFRTGNLNMTNDLKKVVAESDLVIITESPKIDDKKALDSTDIENKLKQIGMVLQRGALMIYAGVASLGFTENTIKKTVEESSGFNVGKEVGLSYVRSSIPEWEETSNAISDQEFIVAANDKASLNAASLVMSVLTRKGIRQTMDFRIAELATLFSLARRDVSAALTNEFAVICETAKVDYFETMKFMNLFLDEPDYIPTVDREVKRNGSYLLLESAEDLRVKARLPETARQINEGMVRHAVNLIQNALHKCQKTFRRSRISVSGATGSGTVGDALVKMLEAKGSRINLFDPRRGKSEESDGLHASKRNVTEATENCDCLVIVTFEEQFKRLNLRNLRSIMKTPAAIVDLAGQFEPKRAENEGFIYCRFGRGIEKE